PLPRCAPNCWPPGYMESRCRWSCAWPMRCCPSTPGEKRTHWKLEITPQSVVAGSTQAPCRPWREHGLRIEPATSARKKQLANAPCSFQIQEKISHSTDCTGASSYLFHSKITSWLRPDVWP